MGVTPGGGGEILFDWREGPLVSRETVHNWDEQKRIDPAMEKVGKERRKKSTKTELLQIISINRIHFGSWHHNWWVSIVC